MDYISTQDAAQQWGVSLRHVQRLIKGNRIPGAKKYGNYWMIPKDSARPVDLRRTREKDDGAPPYLSCVLLSAVVPMPRDDPDAVLSTLPDEKKRAQYRAELDYLRGNFDAVKAYYAGVLPSDTTYLCAANIAICAAMCTRDYPLFKEIETSVKEIETGSSSPCARRAASLLPVLAGVCMNAPGNAPDWLKSGELDGFPAEAHPMLLFMRIKYLQSIRDHNGMLAAAQTARILYQKSATMTLVDLYLTCFCACGCYALGRMEDTRTYLKKSVAMCEKGGFVSPLGEYTTWVGGLLEVALKKSTSDFECAVHAHIERTLKNWLFFHNAFARDNASLVLTTKEYQLALLLKEGKTYQQAAEQLNLSVGRIKNLISVIYEKLGVSKKSEIMQYVY